MMKQEIKEKLFGKGFEEDFRGLDFYQAVALFKEIYSFVFNDEDLTQNIGLIKGNFQKIFTSDSIEEYIRYFFLRLVIFHLLPTKYGYHRDLLTENKKIVGLIEIGIDRTRTPDKTMKCIDYIRRIGLDNMKNALDPSVSRKFFDDFCDNFENEAQN